MPVITPAIGDPEAGHVAAEVDEAGDDDRDDDGDDRSPP